jgi:pimeloyl-ACP methyl ester carboxylesterase
MDVILIPGLWLDGSSWDKVVPALEQAGLNAHPLTLPGMESRDADRSKITFEDHVGAITNAVKAGGERVVLAVHSGAGASGYAATDRVPENIAHMVYVDSGPATAPLDANFEGDDFPLPSWEDLDENLDGISQEQLAAFRERAVPEPAGAMREFVQLTNDERLNIPTTAICTAFTSDDYKKAVKEGQTWLGGYADIRDITWIDLPTSHWPMWSRPKEIATILGDIAQRAAR